MGNGIAHVFALNGYHVNLVDLNKDLLNGLKQQLKKIWNGRYKKEIISSAEMKTALAKSIIPQQNSKPSPIVILVIEAVS